MTPYGLTLRVDGLHAGKATASNGLGAPSLGQQASSLVRGRDAEGRSRSWEGDGMGSMEGRRRETREAFRLTVRGAGHARQGPAKATARPGKAGQGYHLMRLPGLE